jgi:thioredoxin-like negative regulator of GroEL
MFKILQITSLAFLATIANAVLPVEKNNFIYELTDENFDFVMSDRIEVMLVAFTAPWCSKCKELQPIYEESAAYLDTVRPKSYLGHVDCAAQQELRARF